ncbi:polysaccharide biosynthesis C-terminal domain-containing protein, partial [Patescibacteria group bacterium]|nr:polysaccharide biosynthesis C-terminal domain-containing protein [Patescibacteria group bacterium]
KMRVSLILLATLAILPQSIAFTFDAIFVAIQKLQFSAIALFISGLITTLVGLILIENGFGVWGAVNALIVGQVIYAVALTYLLYKQEGIFFSAIKLSVIKEALLGSLPYGVLSVLGLLYFKIDSILLSYIKGNFEAGIYGAAFKFLEAITFIPSAFSLALFPVLARTHEFSPKDIRKLYFKSLKVMFILGGLALFGYMLILPEVIRIFLPNYLSSITVIKILSLSIPFMFVHVPAVIVLLSTDKYLKEVLALSVFAVAFNIIANLIYIPQYGFIAASWVTVASEVLSFSIFFIFVKDRILDKLD